MSGRKHKRTDETETLEKKEEIDGIIDLEKRLSLENGDILEYVKDQIESEKPRHHSFLTNVGELVLKHVPIPGIVDMILSFCVPGPGCGPYLAMVSLVHIAKQKDAKETSALCLERTVNDQDSVMNHIFRHTILGMWGKIRTSTEPFLSLRFDECTFGYPSEIRKLFIIQVCSIPFWYWSIDIPSLLPISPKLVNIERNTDRTTFYNHYGSEYVLDRPTTDSCVYGKARTKQGEECHVFTCVRVLLEPATRG